MSKWRMATLVALIGWMVGVADAQQPGWSPVIIARGAYREQLESTPMVERPNRPLHIYGNTVRRNYYRGTSPLVARRGR